jgi:hypothetical protein
VAQSLLAVMTMAVVHDARAQWRLFIGERPGQRFVNAYRRTQRDRSIAKRVTRVAIGVVVTAGGILMWFLPGPGWLFVFFGLSMFARESCALARFLDRAELTVRGGARHLRQWWWTVPPTRRALAVVFAVACVALGSAVVWAAWA